MSTALGNQRRVRGTGGISKRTMHRKNGGPDYVIWQGQVILDGSRWMCYGHSQKDVAAKLAAHIAAPAAAVVTNGRKTVREYLTDWLETVSLKPGTDRNYRSFVAVHLIPALGSIKVDKLTGADVAKMLRDRPALAPRTKGHLRAVLRSALQVGVEKGELLRNVAKGKAAGVPAQTAKIEPVFLTPASVTRLLDVTKGDRLSALYVTAVKLGAREGELLGLLWSDVDFKNGKLSFSKQLQRVGGKLVFQPLKSKRSRRTVFMGASVAAALAAHRDRQSVEIAGPTDYVFRTATGAGLTADSVRTAFHAAVLRAGLPAMRFHDLRHTCASIRLDIGESMLSVSRLLGHSTITLTANTYGHLLPESGRAAADAMDAAC
jgi:integrase